MKTLREDHNSTYSKSQLLISRNPKSPRNPLVVSFFILVTFVITSCTPPAQESSPILHRLMLFKFKAEASQAQIDDVKHKFYGLKEKVPGLLDVVWAQDIEFDPEKQFTVALTLSFTSEEAVKEYEEHPDHQAISKIGPEIVEDFFLMNYWTGVKSNKDVASSKY